MPDDVTIGGGAGHPSSESVMPASTSASAIREAVLRREIAQLTRERNKFVAEVEELTRQLALSGGASPQGRPLARPAFAADPFATALELHALRESGAAKDALIRALYSSTSWRVTAPLRALSAILGRGTTLDPEDMLERTNLKFGTSLPPGQGVAKPEPALRLAARSRRSSEPEKQGSILVVADYLPLFDQQSGGLRLKTIIGLIIGLGWDVTFCSFLTAEASPGPLATPDGIARYETALRDIGVSRFIYGTEAARVFLNESGTRIRHALVSFPIVATEFIPIIRLHCPWARVIFDTVDFHYLRMNREAELRQDDAIRQEARVMLEQELACVRSADLTFAVTAAERSALLDFAPDCVVEVLPNVFTVPETSPGPAGREGLLFVGGFWHQPNGDAVLWFAREIWPLLRAAAPDLVFRIVGANPTSEILALARQPNIEVLGYVPELSPYLDNSRVFVAPLRFGAGMKGKVGQSLAHGLPVVATAVGAEGMQLEDGVHLLVAETPEAFAEQVLRLLREDDLWTALQRAGRTLIQQTLSEDVIRKQLNGVLRG
jgi:glycosyltransferase involved in cell wall biosynthesis